MDDWLIDWLKDGFYQEDKQMINSLFEELFFHQEKLAITLLNYYCSEV